MEETQKIKESDMDNKVTVKCWKCGEILEFVEARGIVSEPLYRRQITKKEDDMKYNPKTIGIWIQALEFVVIAGIGAFIIAATIKFINLYW